MLEEIGWGIYFCTTQSAVEKKILNGWCAWEYAHQNGGTSPFPAHKEVEDLLGSRLCCDRTGDLPSPHPEAAEGVDDLWRESAVAVPPRKHVLGCSPLEFSAAFYDSDAGQCTHVPMDVAARLPGRHLRWR